MPDINDEPKLCPFMSRGEILPNGDHILAMVYCQTERCAAWGATMPIGKDPVDGGILFHKGCRLIP